MNVAPVNPEFVKAVMDGQEDFKVAHNDRAHAKLGASSAFRWINCPGSVKLCEEVPNKSGEAAQIGTTVHELIDKTMKLEIESPHELVGTYVNGFLIDEDMATAAQMHIDYVEERAKKYRDRGWQVTVEVEVRVSLNLLDHEWGSELFGTADTIIIAWMPTATGPAYHVEVIDFKNGRNLVFVDGDFGEAGPYNPQLMYYALGAIFYLLKKVKPNEYQQLITPDPLHKYRDNQRNLFLSIPDLLEILQITVIQPNASAQPIRSRQLDAHDVLQFLNTITHHAKDLLEWPDSKKQLKLGDHCKWCPAKSICPQHTKTAYEVLENHGLTADKLSNRDQMPPEVLGELLVECDRLETAIKSIRAQASTLLEIGRDVPGWKLVPSRPMRKWTDKNKLIHRLLTEFKLGPDEYMKSELKTPAQLEKTLKKEFASLSDLIVEESSSMKLQRHGGAFSNLDHQQTERK